MCNGTLRMVRTFELTSSPMLPSPRVIPLFLPAGHVVSWDGDVIVSLVGGDGKDRWSPRAAEVLRKVEEKLEEAWQQSASGEPPS